MNKITKDVIICECFSNEHQLMVVYIPGDDEFDFDSISFEIHLNPCYRFWKRLINGVKYIFGFRSSYGHWDNFLLKNEDCDMLINKLQKMKQNNDLISSGK